MRNDDWSEEGKDLGSMNCLMGTTSTDHFRVYSDNQWPLFRKLPMPGTAALQAGERPSWPGVVGARASSRRRRPSRLMRSRASLPLACQEDAKKRAMLARGEPAR